MKGVDLVGTPTKSTLFPEGFIPAKTTPALLSKSAVWRNKRTLATLPWDEDHRKRDILWEQTMLEVAKGYLRGPFCSEQELVDALGTGDFLINKRFLLLQGEAQKPRVIHDCKASGLNSAFTCVDKLILQDFDFLMALTSLAGGAVNERSVCVRLQGGELLQGTLSREYAGSPNWKGRCLDLAKAYRQVPIPQRDLKYAVLAVRDPKNQNPRFFISNSIPFGACSSVYAFTRLSRSLHHLMVNVLAITGSVFFDDFPLLEAVSASCTSAVEALLKALGWLFAKDEEKGRDFSPAFNVLGAHVNLPDLSSGLVVLSNKDGRIERICQQVESSADQAGRSGGPGPSELRHRS